MIMEDDIVDRPTPIHLRFYKVGKIKRETERAILVGQTWIPKSAIEEQIELQARYTGTGLHDKDLDGEYLFILRYKPARGSRISLTAYFIATDGRVYLRDGQSVSW